MKISNVEEECEDEREKIMSFCFIHDNKLNLGNYNGQNSSHLSNMKLSHVLRNVKLRYNIQLPIEANLVLIPNISMTASNT